MTAKDSGIRRARGSGAAYWIASLVLAEVARQVGTRMPREGRRRERPEYLLRLPLTLDAAGDSVSVDDLDAY